MSEGSRTAPEGRDSAESPDENAQLDTAIHQADQRLVASLKRDEARRRRRRWLALGGFAMTITAAGLVVGLVFSGAGSGSADSRRPPSPQDIEKAEATAAQGWQLWQKQQFARAEEKFEQAVKLDPNAVNAWNGLGWARFNNGDWDKAEEPFKRCVAIEPSHPGAHNGLGQLYFFTRQYDKAEAHWTKVAKTASAAWYGMTKLYLLKANYKEAAKWAKKVLEQQKNDPLAREMLAAADAGRLPEDLRRKIEPPERTKKGSAADHTTQGWKDFQRGMPTKAAAEFRAAIEKDSNNVNAHNGLGFCLLNTGKPAEAKPHFQKCLDLQPKHWGAVNGMARCLKEEGQTKQAIALWEKMAQECPAPNAANAALAQVYLDELRYEKAIEQFQILLKANPNDPYAQEGLAKAKAALEKEKQ
ncbi:MAG: tetratricopeptide repeat protein [Phycisphaerae bacterium]|nr:tetratricopeptide repeat protein [Phycisphaerae bacterium]